MRRKEKPASPPRPFRSSRRPHALNLLVTAGGTVEYIDPVRYISNVFSGFLGLEIASAAKARGHDVTLIRAASAAEMLRHNAISPG